MQPEIPVVSFCSNLMNFDQYKNCDNLTWNLAYNSNNLKFQLFILF